MVRIVLRHRSGTRAAQNDVLEVDARTEVVIGESGISLVQVASPRGAPGERWHARLIPVEGAGRRFVLVDLESPVGIYVNRKRVVDAVVLRPGDVIQIGQQGTELEFTIEAALP